MIGINDMNGMKKCCRCGEIKPLSEYYINRKNKGGLDYHCKKCHKEHNKKYPRPASYMRDYYAKNKKRMLYQEKEYHKRRPDVRKRASRKYRMKIKSQCFTHYGGNPPKCACCGESQYEFLSIDHINNDGAKQRRELNGMNIYLWLIKHDFPEGYQVLCMNCQFGKRINDGVCPHEKEIK